MSILLYIGGSILIDLIVWIVIFAIIAVIIKYVLDALKVIGTPRNIAWAIFALIILIFIIYRYIGI